MPVPSLSRAETLRGLIRLTHPFPTLLTALLTGTIALLAGGGVPTALRLGAAMLALQASIGSLNDLLDVEDDRRVKPAKPLVAGIVGRDLARTVVVAGLVGGLGLAALSGPGTVVVGAAGVGAGYLYDARLKRSAWGPGAFAVGIPLLPIFAWFGAVGTLPDIFGSLIPAAILAGLALALSNALADDAHDRSSGVPTAVSRLGAGLAWWVHVGALVGAVAIALAALSGSGAPEAALWIVGLGCAILGVGAIAARPAAWARRPHGWEIEAVGLGILAAGWLLARIPVVA